MIHRIVQFALRQRFLVLMVTMLVIVAGAISFQRMPVDAYPDLSPPMVELITQWPGHAAEEVERLTTLPLELAMNGTPNLVVMRSISLYGLSDVILTFDEGTDPYFAREIVFQRIADASLPDRRHSQHVAALQPERPCLPLRARKPRSHAAGVAHLRRLDHRARVSLGPRRRRRFRLWRHHDAVSGAARSGAALQLSHPRGAGDQRADGEQRQHRRRLLFAGRAVLLRSRPRLAAKHGRHRRRGCGQPERRARCASKISPPWRSATRRASANLGSRKTTTPSKA